MSSCTACTTTVVAMQFRGGRRVRPSHDARPPPVTSLLGSQLPDRMLFDSFIGHEVNVHPAGHLLGAVIPAPSLAPPRPRRLSSRAEHPEDCGGCGCQLYGHLMRPGHTHESDHRVDLAARLFPPARRQLVRRVQVAMPVPRHGADGGRCNDRHTRSAPTAAADIER
jgi:hypothetical protein